jgi:hypothetical protein
MSVGFKANLVLIEAVSESIVKAAKIFNSCIKRFMSCSSAALSSSGAVSH